MQRIIKQLIICVSIGTMLFATQLKQTNMNPDPKGEPWYLDHYKPEKNRNFMITR